MQVLRSTYSCKSKMFILCWPWDGLKFSMRIRARVQIRPCPQPPLVFSHELLGRLRTGFLVVSPLRLARVFLHCEQGQSYKQVWLGHRITYLFTSFGVRETDAGHILQLEP
jgi:hypothetical protein